MKILDFNERLKDSILIADGAMGSMLHEAVGTQRCFDELNATEPEAVFRVHQAYIEAGAQIIETNTFGANRFKLAPLGLADEVQRLNSRGVKIAREARESASREVLIAGSIGPLGLGVQSRHPAPDEIQDVFHEQALALEERGVDFYILETFSYIEEILLAVDAIRSFSGLPIVAQLTYSEEGTTYGDLRPADAAAQLVGELALFVDARDDRGAPVFQLAQIQQAFLEITQLRVVEIVGHFLPVAGDERNSRSFVEKLHRGRDLARLDGQFGGDALYDLECYGFRHKVLVFLLLNQRSRGNGTRRAHVGHAGARWACALRPGCWSGAFCHKCKRAQPQGDRISGMFR